jgi:hypothetical protein
VKWNDLGFEYQKTRLFPTLIPSLVFQGFSRGFPASISGQIAGKIWKKSLRMFCPKHRWTEGANGSVQPIELTEIV